MSKLGCKCFALLFDDIDPRLKLPDSNLYKSSAEAQSILANELFQYLKKTRFLFCPTGKLIFHISSGSFSSFRCSTVLIHVQYAAISILKEYIQGCLALVPHGICTLVYVFMKDGLFCPGSYITKSGT